MSKGDNLNRRGFIKALAVTAAAATTVGGGAALLSQNKRQTVITPVVQQPSLPVMPPATTLVEAQNQTSDLLAQLASAQADNMQLAAELAAAERRLAGLEASNGNASQVNETLQLELTDAQNRVGLLAGLVALYEQLDDLDMSEVVQNGLSAVGETFTELVDRVPTVEEGIAAGQAALDEFEEQLPLVEAGRDWLETHISRLAELYQSAGDVLQTILEATGSFFDKLNLWFADILGWLPFGVGEKATLVMDSLTNLLNETPTTISGLQGNIAQPLDTWLKAENGATEMPIKGRMIKPLREMALDPAGELASQTITAKTTYQTQLADPVATMTQRRQLVQQLITDYRERHQI